jgi:replicative DNA helicase
MYNKPETVNSASHASASHQKPWRKYSDILEESLEYVAKRARKEIVSLKTSWEGFNKIGLNGIEWQSLYVLAARPGVGKTLIAGTIARALQENNKDQDFMVLHFQFEMLGRNMGVRELSASNNIDIRYLQSAQDDGMPPLTKGDYEKLSTYVGKQSGRKEYVIDRSMSVPDMANAIRLFYNEYKKPFVVTLDHTLLVRQSASETSKQVTLQNLATMLTEMKNKLPVTFIILTQLNREIDNAERQRPGKLENYPTEADVFGSDYLLQCADVMIAYNRPAKYNISRYGPQKYIIGPSDKYLLAMHVLKNRFGETSIQWYKADYAKMEVVEAYEPDKEPYTAKK